MQDLATKFANMTIQSDFIFKKVMSRKRICKHLLEELLQIEIADINYIEAEKTLEPEYTSRGIRLDIIVADDKNTHYNQPLFFLIAAIRPLTASTPAALRFSTMDSSSVAVR